MKVESVVECPLALMALPCGTVTLISEPLSSVEKNFLLSRNRLLNQFLPFSLSGMSENIRGWRNFVLAEILK